MILKFRRHPQRSQEASIPRFSRNLIKQLEQITKNLSDLERRCSSRQGAQIDKVRAQLEKAVLELEGLEYAATLNMGPVQGTRRPPKLQNEKER